MGVNRRRCSESLSWLFFFLSFFGFAIICSKHWVRSSFSFSFSSFFLWFCSNLIQELYKWVLKFFGINSYRCYRASDQVNFVVVKYRLG